MERPPTILWFRGADLRLSDNPAVEAAVETAGPVVPVYVHDPHAAGEWALGANAQAWRSRSVASLDAGLREIGSRLVVRQGSAERVITELVAETGAMRLVFARRWEPWAREQESRVVRSLESALDIITVTANLLAEPGAVLTRGGTAYKVFTPFYKTWRNERSNAGGLAPMPSRLLAPDTWPDTVSPDVLIGSRASRHPGMPGALDEWSPGEGGALQRLATFTGMALTGYETDRDRPDLAGTSQLSPHLAHGEISVARVVHAVRAAGEDLGVGDQAEAYVRQLAWREFAAAVLAAEPTLPARPVRPAFERFAWRTDDVALEAWQRGHTGFPIIDAGMKQLLMTGWMHNRVRMLAASFLTKDLLVPWQEGQRWFWENLVDADLASNAFGWQWVAGSGHDASPYFRIFNPTSQGRRFDPDGDYVRRWIPHLAGLGGADAHEPASLTEDVLAGARVELGDLYPRPVIDHGEARVRALSAYEAIRAD